MISVATIEKAADATPALTDAPAPPPRVSVIMNVFNGAAYLREALDSVLAQTFKSFEVIFWDDCSTDESAQVPSEYTDPRIRYFLASHRVPLGQARELAMQEARGEWIAFLDQDDVWLADKLQRQLALVDSDPKRDEIALVYGRTLRFTPSGRERDYDHRHEFGPLPQGDVFEELFRRSCFICMSSAMLRRSAVRELGPIPPEIQIIPDYYLFTGIARHHRARATEEICCRYRVHGGNMSWATQRRMQEECLWLVNLWARDLPPELVLQRLKIHHTVKGFADARRLRTLIGGAARIVTKGSAIFLLSRPFARAFRAIRRTVVMPYMYRVKVTPNGAVPVIR